MSKNLQNLTQDDLIAEIVAFEEYVDKLGSLLGIRVENKRLVNFTGEPLGKNMREAIAQEIVRSHELVRLRQKVWNSDFTDQEKRTIIDFLNLTARFIETILKRTEDAEGLTTQAERVAFLLGGLCNVT